MNLSENFTLEELTASYTARSRKINNTPDEMQIENLTRLCVEILQPIRNHWGNPLSVTSGFRSPELNRVVGGSVTSQHLKGEAADIISSDNRKLWKLITEMIKKGEIRVGQLIDEKNLSWIHISLPSGTRLNQTLRL